MSKPYWLYFGDIGFTVEPIRRGRNINLVKVHSTGTRLWGINNKGKVYLDANFSRLKQYGAWPAHINPDRLDADDIKALGALGKLDADTVLKAVEAKRREAKYTDVKEDIEWNIDRLRNYGVELPDTIEQQTEDAARRAASNL